MVSAAPYDLAEVPHGDLLPGVFSEVLPAEYFLEDEESDLAAGFQKARRNGGSGEVRTSQSRGYGCVPRPDKASTLPALR